MGGGSAKWLNWHSLKSAVVVIRVYNFGDALDRRQRYMWGIFTAFSNKPYKE